MSIASAVNTELAPDASSAELLVGLVALVTRSSMIDVNASEGDVAAMATVVADVAAVAEASVDIFNALERRAAPQVDVEDFSELELDTFVGTRAELQAPRLEDLCFAASLELSRALRELHDARAVDEQLAAAETARRKLQRASFAVFESDGAVGVVPRAAVDRLRARCAVELESALAVRALYADFRRGLRRSASNDGEAVLMALRYAAGALAAISASPHYHSVRIADRALLRRQRERLLEWSRAGRTVSAGLEALEDIAICADLLRDISRRQELRAHDTELIRRLLADSNRELSAWLPELERLRGLDDQLDRLAGQARAAYSHDLAVEIVLRLSGLV